MAKALRAHESAFAWLSYVLPNELLGRRFYRMPNIHKNAAIEIGQMKLAQATNCGQIDATLLGSRRKPLMFGKKLKT